MAKIQKLSATFAHVSSIDVYLWGERIGVTVLDPRYGYYAFRYTPEFRRLAIEPSPLQMPTDPDGTHLFTGLPVETYQRLPAMLSDALPDDFGNALVNRWMADRGITAADITPLDRLAYMSHRAMGALQFKPSRGPATRVPFAIEMSDLVNAARQALSGTAGDDEHAHEVMRGIIEVGTSAGGARAKAVIAWNPGTGEIRSGQLTAPPGFEHWLLKFDGMGKDQDLGPTQHYGRIEFAYHLMARAAGIAMTDCRLLHENGRAHFMTRRFDREGSDVRHHIQTLCALSHIDYRKIGTNSYAQLCDAASQLKLPYEDREEIFRRMTFNVLGQNCDDHSKNFAFRLRRGGSWELAPAYDITFAHSPSSRWTHQHLMSVNGKFKDISQADLLAVANRFGIGTAARVIEQVRTAIKAWAHFAQQADLPAETTHHISALLLTLT
jgi:serine/threonine-protein kinase HipA